MKADRTKIMNAGNQTIIFFTLASKSGRLGTGVSPDKTKFHSEPLGEQRGSEAPQKVRVEAGGVASGGRSLCLPTQGGPWDEHGRPLGLFPPNKPKLEN